MALGQRHIYVVERSIEEAPPPHELPSAPKYTPKVKPVEGVKQVVLSVDRPEEMVFIGCNLSEERETKLLHFLRNNADVWMNMHVLHTA